MREGRIIRECQPSEGSRTRDQITRRTDQPPRSRHPQSEEHYRAGEETPLLNHDESTTQPTTAHVLVEAFCNFIGICCIRRTTSDTPSSPASPTNPFQPLEGDSGPIPEFGGRIETEQPVSDPANRAIGDRYRENVRDSTENLSDDTGLSRHYSKQGWQGTSDETFRAFISKIAQDMKIDHINDIETLKNEIYNIYTAEDVNLDISQEENEQYMN